MFEWERFETVGSGPIGGPPQIEPADLVEELDAVLSRITRDEARAVELLARINETEAWRHDGYSSPTAMLKHRNSMHSGTALQMVVRANAIDSTPFVGLAYARSAITSPQVDALLHARATAPVPFEAEEPSLVEVALDTPLVSDLRKKLDYWLSSVAADDQAADRQIVREARSLTVSRDGEMVTVRGWFDIEAGETVLAALDPGPSSAGDTRSTKARRADQFLDVINGATQRPNLTIHVSADAFTKTPTCTSETSYGTFVTSEDARRAACDATIRRVVLGPHSEPLDVGRAKRLVTPAIRTAVAARDLRCVFPGCDRPDRWCDVHHIVHWADGGATAVDNLTLLCRHHHRLVHDAGWTIEGQPPSLSFYRPDGSLLDRHTPNRPDPNASFGRSYTPGQLVEAIRRNNKDPDP
jgi:hypothetical protein